MAKLKKRRLRWKASRSSQVVGYRLYWSGSGDLDYNADFVDLGNVTEVVLPDDIENFPVAAQPVEIGLTAVDELGNESDMVCLRTPYQFNVPAAPTDLRFENTGEFFVYQPSDESRRGPEPMEVTASDLPQGRSSVLPFADLLSLEDGVGDK